MAGSALPLVHRELGTRRLWRLLAFGSGALLSIAFLHALPEAYQLAPWGAGLAVLGTFLVLYAAESVTIVHACGDIHHSRTSAFTPLSALSALGIHAAVDGMAIGIGLQQNPSLGGVISFGVILHKFSDGLTLTGLLRAAGYSAARQWLLAAVLATATPAAAILSFHSSAPLPPAVIGTALGIATGSFLYVASADLLPRIHEVRDRWSFVFFLAGVALISAI